MAAGPSSTSLHAQHHQGTTPALREGGCWARLSGEEPLPREPTRASGLGRAAPQECPPVGRLLLWGISCQVCSSHLWASTHNSISTSFSSKGSCVLAEIPEDLGECWDCPSRRRGAQLLLSKAQVWSQMVAQHVFTEGFRGAEW